MKFPDVVPSRTPGWAQIRAEYLEQLLARVLVLYWNPVAQPPEPRRPIEMTGPSGYIAPNQRYVCSGYYDPEFRPLSPWLHSSSECIEDGYPAPTHWRYLTPGPVHQFTEVDQMCVDCDGTNQDLCSSPQYCPKHRGGY